MIEKLIAIKNVGPFVNFSPNKKYNWDGNFKQTNIIYAANGSGKTTLSTILNSASKNDPELLRHKQSIKHNASPTVKILISGNRVVEYHNFSWTEQLQNVEIFDIHFIEEFLFLSSISNEKNTDNLLRLLLGQKGVSLKNKFRRLKQKCKNISIELKKRKKSKRPEDPFVKKLQDTFTSVRKLLDELYIEFNDYSQPIFNRYVELTNLKLSKFTRKIRLHGFINPNPFYDAERFSPSLYIEIDGTMLRFKNPDLSKKIGSAKFLLSEGDKNAIALSFFLARLEIVESKNKIVVIDDPLSSFDYQRRTSTLNFLASLSNNCSQFFLLSHDIYFARALKEKLSFKTTLSLKIEQSAESSIIVSHDIAFETMSGYRKDIQRIKDFQLTHNTTEHDKREVIRCFRPVLETVLRSKYFEYFDDNEWLGNMISKIRKSKNSDPISKIKPVLSDIITLNEFTKTFHHSETLINLIDDVELLININLLKQTILEI